MCSAFISSSSGAAAQLPGLTVGNAAAVDAALLAAEGVQDDEVGRMLFFLLTFVSQ
jgi:hypothetical protein